MITQNISRSANNNSVFTDVERKKLHRQISIAELLIFKIQVTRIRGRDSRIVVPTQANQKKYKEPVLRTGLRWADGA